MPNYGSSSWGARSEPEQPLARFALLTVDAAIALSVLAVPLVFGGRHDTGRLLFILCAATAAVAWCVRQAATRQGVWYRNGAVWIPVLAAAMLAVQCSPLPPVLDPLLVSGSRQELPLWNADPGYGLGPWRTLSVAPEETRLALANLIAYGLLFVTVHQRLRRVSEIRRLMQLLAGGVLFAALFALPHTLFSNGLHLWLYDQPHASPTRGFSGGFTNRNHFADYLVLGIGPIAAWIVLRSRANLKAFSSRGRRRSQTPPVSQPVLLGCVALGIVTAMVILSASRGGAVALLASAAVLLAAFASRSLIAARHVAAIGLIILTLSGLASLYGLDAATDRLETLLTGDIEQVDSGEGRRTIWQANLAAVAANPIAGTGAGSHRIAHPMYVPEHNGLVYTHAENGYLQVLSENGLAGGALLLAGIGFCLFWTNAALRRPKDDEPFAYAAAAAAGLTASLVHSAVDFVWYIPGCMGPTLMLAACQLRLAQLASDRRERTEFRLPVVSGWGLTAAVALIASWSVLVYTGPAVASVHWDRYSRTAIANRDFIDAEMKRARPRKGLHAVQTANTEEMIQNLRTALSFRPRSARIHSALASRYTELFDLRQAHSENALTAAQLRDTVRSCGFSDPRQLRDWLSKAIGENLVLLMTAREHAFLSAHYCPVAAAPYIALAETGFLTGQPPATTDALLDQAIRVRPKNPRVLYTAGAYKLNNGSPQEGEDLWKLSYAVEGSHRLQIIRVLAYQTTASSFLETYQPGWDSLRDVWTFFRDSQPEAELLHFVDYAAEAARAEPPLEDAHREGLKWVALSEMQAAVGRDDDAIRSLAAGYQRTPNSWHVRRTLGLRLVGDLRHRVAEPHLRWCLGRRPDDTIVQDALVQAAKARLAAARNTESVWK